MGYGELIILPLRKATASPNVEKNTFFGFELRDLLALNGPE